MAEVWVDMGALYAALGAARTGRGITWRQVAWEVGVSPSTFSRMRMDKKPDVDSFAKIIHWLGVPADRFVNEARPQDRGQPDLMTEIIPILRRRADLSPADRAWLE